MHRSGRAPSRIKPGRHTGQARTSCGHFIIPDSGSKIFSRSLMVLSLLNTPFDRAGYGALCHSVDEDVAKSQVEDYCKQVFGNFITATNDNPLKISGPRSSYLTYSEGAFIIGLETSSRAYHIMSAFRPVSRSRPCLERLFSGLGLAQRLQ